MPTAHSGPLSFAYWVPNISGGLVTSTVEQQTDYRHEYNVSVARIAEQAGFEYALTQVRTITSHEAEHHHESTSFALALLLATERLKVITAVQPGLWHPGVLASWLATADHLSNGRAAVNVVSGWLKEEFTQLGEPWLEHDERYRRSAEFIQVLKAIWTESPANYAGDFYRIHDVTLKPKPLSWVGRPHPEICQGGNSTADRGNGARYADWYFSNGSDFDGVTAQLADLRRIAADSGRAEPPRFGLNGFVIVRDTEAEAQDALREIIAKAQVPAIQGFGTTVRPADASASEHRSIWADTDFEDLAQYNDGFRTRLIGTAEHVAERIVAYRKLGVNLILAGFLNPQEEIEVFGRTVLPLVRELEEHAGLTTAPLPALS